MIVNLQAPKPLICKFVFVSVLFSIFVDFWQTFILSFLENAKSECKKFLSNEFRYFTAASYDGSVITV